MQKSKQEHGFTLIEMLVVIAIIAVLVAIIIPTVSNATARAKAAADAANLRSVMGAANALLVENDADRAATAAGMQTISCSTFPGAEAYIGFESAGFINAFYENGGSYYDMYYFADIADKGSTTLSAASTSGYTLYQVGGTG